MGAHPSKASSTSREREIAARQYMLGKMDPDVREQIDFEYGGDTDSDRIRRKPGPRSKGGNNVRRANITLSDSGAFLDSSRDAPKLAKESVIKIFVDMSNPDLKVPWQNEGVMAATGSGVVILLGEEKCILTAAHVVGHASTYVAAQQVLNPEKASCDIVNVCHDCDLALLRPKNPKFLADIDPIKLSRMPALRDRIYVVGYPVGGEELSLTEGVVSRIEVQPYAHSLRYLLAVTVDAAINAGNSGGPVLTGENLLAGIAFQAQEDAENVGHIIPPVIIQQFLEGVEKFGDKYEGFPALGITVQTLENVHLRKHLGMAEEASGALIVKVGHGATGEGVWKAGDVLLEIDGRKVGNNGTINLHGIRCSLAAGSQSHHVGEALPVKLLRDKEEIATSVTLRRLVEVCPTVVFDKHPEYLVHCGLLFQPLSVGLLEEYFQSALLAPSDLLGACTGSLPEDLSENPATQVVVLTRVFKDDINVGYEEEEFSIIAKANGEKVRNIQHLSDIIRAEKSAPLILNTSSQALVILPSYRESKHAHKSILRRYNVPADHYFIPKKSPASLEPPTSEKKRRSSEHPS